MTKRRSHTRTSNYNVPLGLALSAANPGLLVISAISSGGHAPYPPTTEGTPQDPPGLDGFDEDVGAIIGVVILGAIFGLAVIAAVMLIMVGW